MSPRQPLDGIELLLIDGNNLLHRQRGVADETGVRGLLVDLQRRLPSGVRAIVVPDGHPAPGTGLAQKIAGGLEVRHAGSRSADDAVVAEVVGLPWATRGRTIVVTDDRTLDDRSRTAGALTRRLDWLTALPAAQPAAGSPAKATIGQGRPPRTRR